ncbi:hypothetical protein [Bradyrhizobium pachyrhizi]|uniref:hypothetical protein n=1 Tax=Bradyrhizobium pachyrhizi TaxID=280333 RepID=UPI00187523F3|nr:hypothetical protein [Bradyrhizobium pachyrhizi]
MSDDYSQPWSRPLIRDSGAAAGIPSRSNVWEYDYPDAGSRPVASAGDFGAAGRLRSPREYGYPEVPVGGAAARSGASGGLLGRIVALTDNGADSVDWRTPAIASPSSGKAFNEGVPPVRFLERIFGPSGRQADTSDLRYPELSLNELADFLQSYAPTNYPGK